VSDRERSSQVWLLSRCPRHDRVVTAGYVPPAMPHLRTTRLLLMILALTLLVAACSDDDGDVAASDGTTTTTETTTSDEDGSTTTSPPDEPLEDEPPLHDDGPSGSGCTPGNEELPDGWWYGLVDGEIGSEVSVDLACYYIGAAAEAEAQARGDEVNNDHYTVNDNEQLRTLVVADDATARCVELGSGVQTTDCEPGDVDGPWAVWLRVDDGAVDRVVEQYAP
jgi:hypothetical protein